MNPITIAAIPHGTDRNPQIHISTRLAIPRTMDAVACPEVTGLRRCRPALGWGRPDRDPTFSPQYRQRIATARICAPHMGQFFIPGAPDPADWAKSPVA